MPPCAATTPLLTSGSAKTEVDVATTRSQLSFGGASDSHPNECPGQVRGELARCRCGRSGGCDSVRQLTRISTPPPMAIPCTAAMTGLLLLLELSPANPPALIFCTNASVSFAFCKRCEAPSGVVVLSAGSVGRLDQSTRSWPAQKARPEPEMMRIQRELSVSYQSKTEHKSFSNA